MAHERKPVIAGKKEGASSIEKQEFVLIAESILELMEEAKVQSTNIKFSDKNKLTAIEEKDEMEGDAILKAERLKLDNEIEKLGKDITTDQLITLVAESTLTSKYGNCEGLSMLFFELAAPHLNHASLELAISGDKHMFAIIGRNPKSDIDKPAGSWGKNCMVVDPWAKRIMTPAKFQLYRLYDLDPVYAKEITGSIRLFHDNGFNDKLVMEHASRLGAASPGKK